MKNIHVEYTAFPSAMQVVVEKVWKCYYNKMKKSKGRKRKK